MLGLGNGYHPHRQPLSAQSPFAAGLARIGCPRLAGCSRHDARPAGCRDKGALFTH